MNDDANSTSAKGRGSAGSSLKEKGKDGLKAKSRNDEVADYGAKRKTMQKDDQHEVLNPRQKQKSHAEDKAGGGKRVSERDERGSIKSKDSSKPDIRPKKSSKIKPDDAKAVAATVVEKEHHHKQDERRSKDGGMEDKPTMEEIDRFAIFRVTNPEIIPLARRTQNSVGEGKVEGGERDSLPSGKIGKYQQPGKIINPVPPLLSAPGSQQKQPPPPPSSVEEEFLEIEELELEQYEMNSYDEDGYRFLEYESKEEEEDSFDGNGEEEEGIIPIQHIKSRKSLLRETWENISEEISRTFSSPSRVFKLRGYHSEPDLSLPFEDKFDLKWTPVHHKTREDNNNMYDGWGGLRKMREKFVSCEDITSHISRKEHPDLVRGALSEVKLRSYAIDDGMKSSWWELYEAERKRFSFFDELFAMGYVVDSLEVLSSPPKDAEGNPVTAGEYFVEADEKHYRKKVDYGRVVFKTKHVYTGNFQDWYFEGPGRYCWQDGTVYQGEFSKGLMHGPGSIHWPDGCTYEGRFIYGKRTGWGVYSSADGQNTYAGEWLNGLPHGHGKMWYDPNDDDSDYYEGQWKRGLPEGVGTRQYATGDRYVGNWIEGMRNGYGIMIWLQERQVYKGEWLDGVPHGTGKHIWYLERSVSNSFPTRHVYQGAWVMGRREGIGKMVYPCGSIYEGRWKNGQRHGKGMFMNPAGDILVGLFRAGSIMGGSDVPLHAPTYDCDYTGLTEWLTVKFKLPFRDISYDEEGKLMEITKNYLPYLRKLYHRAGEYSQKYGRHGLYPAYMKKCHNTNSDNFFRNDTNPPHQHPLPAYPGNPSRHQNVHPQEYSRLNEPEHMKGKVEKPESLDGVNPVTRFGLWLLLRDCDNVLDEVTMAYYDKIWCETPPLSFQTRHNPFEPVYLWQFLQALIVTSVAFCVDVPRLRQHAAEKERRTEVEPLAVSDTTLKGGISHAEHKRALIVRHQKTTGNKTRSPRNASVDDQMMSTKGKGKHKQQSQGKSTVAKEDAKKHSHKKHGEHGKEIHEGVGFIGNSSVVLDRNPVMKSDAHLEGNNENSGVGGAGGRNRTSDNSDRDDRKSEVKGNNALSPKVHGVKVESTRGSGDTEDEMDTLTSGGEYTSDEDDDFERKSVKGQRSNMSSKGMDKRYGHENTSHQQLTGMSISECFESFLSKKLIPCLRREAGFNLPVMPQPLPALVDMYDAFKGIKQRDIIRGKEFFRSSLPHLLFPNAKDALWWHRCPEPLSHQVDVDELLEMFREKFEIVQEDTTEVIENFEEKFESEYLGAQAQNSEMTLALLKLCKENPDSIECPAPAGAVGGHVPILPIIDSEQALQDINEASVEDMTELMDFTTDGQPFAEDELVPEPFLWADDYKCIPVRRKYQHFENINSRDVFNVLHQLYPKLCTGKHEKDLQFELIFCDWLWCISLLAKTSTERECREAWKTKVDRRPFTNPQSLGVYSHYVRLIKNNPYLSPNPPPDFKPKRKPKENMSTTAHAAENEEKKAVKFL